MNKRRKESIEIILAQLEDGYIDLGCHDKDEIEMVKEAMKLLVEKDSTYTDKKYNLYIKTLNPLYYDAANLVVENSSYDECKEYVVTHPLLDGLYYDLIEDK